MKRKIAMILVIVFIVTLSGCTNSEEQNVLSKQSIIEESGNTLDPHLEIYYMPLTVYTRSPLSKASLISVTEKIVIDHEELSLHLEQLKKLDLAELKPAEEEGYINARIYYHLYLDNGEDLEVVISASGFNMSVNGMEVEYDPAFYEAVLPFLPEDVNKTD